MAKRRDVGIRKGIKKKERERERERETGTEEGGEYLIKDTIDGCCLSLLRPVSVTQNQVRAARLSGPGHLSPGGARSPSGSRSMGPEIDGTVSSPGYSVPGSARDLS